MPGSRGPDDVEGAPPQLSLWQRVLLALPRLHHDGERVPLVERFKEAVVKPVEPSAAAKAKAADVPMSVEELEGAVARADDKERLTGLLLAPVAAGIGLVVTHLLTADDPAARTAKGALNPRHVNPSIYGELALVLLVLSLLMLGLAFFRKRLFLGIVMALYGLAIFNLHYWGFGIPYILAGAWLLVRSYRLQRDLKEAKGEGPGTQGRGRRPTTAQRPVPNKRYTPPTPSRRSPPPKSKRKPEDEQRAG
jgi:hypothetical protein